MFDTNLFALIAVTQAFAPLLIAAKGTVVNIGSIVGEFPAPWQGLYNASKAAVNHLTDQMRIEFSPWGVKAILVITGVIKTKFFANLSSAPHLPETSLYYAAKDDIEPVMAGKTFESGAMDVDAYASAVVSNALKSNPKKHQWVGGSAFPIWLFSSFGWSTIWVSFLLVFVSKIMLFNVLCRRIC